MTVFEFAIYRHARSLMTPGEVAQAEALAEVADHDRKARAALKDLAFTVIRRDVQEHSNGHPQTATHSGNSGRGRKAS